MLRVLTVPVIKSGGYKISALDIEREMLALPYISEVTVVGVEDEEFGQRVAAAIVLRDQDDQRPDTPSETRSPADTTIDRIREDLAGRLARYKMPTLLRIVDDLPKSATGKISKKVLGPALFPANYESLGEVQVWRSSKKVPKARL